MGFFDKLFNKEKKIENNSIKMNEDWGYYSYRYQDNNQTFEALIEYDKLHAKEPSHSILNNCLRLIIFINPEKCSENGLPFKDTALEILALQKEIINNIVSDTRFVAKMSYGYLVELIFQTNDVNSLMEEIKTKVNSTESLIKFDFSKHKGWGFFDEKIKPDELSLLQSSELEKVKKIIAENNSSDTTKSTLIHTFKGKSEDLDIISGALTQSEGFAVKNKQDNILELEREFNLNEIDELIGLNLKIRMFATQQLGLEYLGWNKK